MVSFVIDMVEQLGPLGVGFIVSMDALVTMVTSKWTDKTYLKEMFKCTILLAVVFIAALIILSPIVYLMERGI